MYLGYAIRERVHRAVTSVPRVDQPLATDIGASREELLGNSREAQV